MKRQHEELSGADSTVTISDVLRGTESSDSGGGGEKELNYPYEKRKPGTPPPSPGFGNAGKQPSFFLTHHNPSFSGTQDNHL